MDDHNDGVFLPPPPPPIGRLQRGVGYEVLRNQYEREFGADAAAAARPLDIVHYAVNAEAVKPKYDAEGDVIMEDSFGGRRRVRGGRRKRSRSASAGRRRQSSEWLELVRKVHAKAVREAGKKGPKPLLKDTLQKASKIWRSQKK